MWIEKLTGVYTESLPSGIVIDVCGVGYGVEIPLSAIWELPNKGEKLSLWIHSHVREDSIRLFGFPAYEDKVVFETLLTLNGVGPKVALAILSTLNLSAINRAIIHNDHAIFTSVPGVGARLAEKILVELKPKLEKMRTRAQSLALEDAPIRLSHDDFEELGEETADPFSVMLDDVRSALENLGYKDKAISPITQRLKSEFNLDTPFQELVRKALLYLADKGEKGKKPPRRRTTVEKELF